MIARETYLTILTKGTANDYNDPYMLDQFLSHDTMKESYDSDGNPIVGSAIVGEAVLGGGVAEMTLIPFHAVQALTKEQETSEAPDPEDDVCKAEGGELYFLYAPSVEDDFQAITPSDTIYVTKGVGKQALVCASTTSVVATPPEDIVPFESATSSDESVFTIIDSDFVSLYGVEAGSATLTVTYADYGTFTFNVVVTD